MDDGGAGPGLDGEVVQVGVVVDQHGGDGLRLGLTGVLPVVVLVASTFWPGFSEAIGTAAP
ncbi:MAG: hypothetical protein ACRDOB_20095 [Streptosporangiaceae bacterium]